jgi:predicted metal-dependent phosphoesterase TrpH
MIIDLHVHSRFTRGCDLDPGLLIRRAREAGLDGLCFTELNAIDGAADLHELGRTAGAAAGVKVFVGMELATDRGHYLCYFPEPEAVPDPVQMWGSNAERPWPVAETLAKVSALGAVIIAAHPYDRETPPASGDFIYGLKGLAAVEGYNARRRPQVNNLANEAAESLRLPSIGCSDVRHDIAELGKAATLFQTGQIEDERGLCQALREGHFWPVIFGPPPPGLMSSAGGGSASAGGGGPKSRPPGRRGRPERRRGEGRGAGRR